MTPDAPERFSPAWLARRETADARARSAQGALELADAVRRMGGPGLVVHDLGCGTGSMGRWLAPRLPAPQHWILHDRDADLLARAVAAMPTRSADGRPVTAEGRRSDVGLLRAGDLHDGCLVTASALLDLLSADEVDRLADACCGAKATVLCTLSVAGQVRLQPPDPLDVRIAAAFDAHQRRTVSGRRLLGPDAVAAAVAAFTRRGYAVDVHPSPWQLGPDDVALAEEWLCGWVGAAAEQEPGLDAQEYLRRRRAQARAAQLTATVHHEDLLARPPSPRGGAEPFAGDATYSLHQTSPHGR